MTGVVANPAFARKYSVMSRVSGTAICLQGNGIYHCCSECTRTTGRDTTIVFNPDRRTKIVYIRETLATKASVCKEIIPMAKGRVTFWFIGAIFETTRHSGFLR
jgi:hypothetical protein